MLLVFSYFNMVQELSTHPCPISQWFFFFFGGGVNFTFGQCNCFRAIPFEILRGGAEWKKNMWEGGPRKK